VLPGRHKISSRVRAHPGRIRDVFLALLGILIFAAFIHSSFPLILIAVGGLAGTAAVIGFSTKDTGLREAFGIMPLNRRVLIYMPVAAALGMLMAILTRNRFELSLIPAGFTGIALVAPLVGTAEELLFRGYIQSRLHPLGKLCSIVCASAAHTCYKLLVILSLGIPLQFDFFFLIFWTFIGGLLFGTLRELSGNTIPPVIAHAVFDIVLYGTLTTAPVWVWS
jgi:membrane protease YdiL (CAAX protease family)